MEATSYYGNTIITENEYPRDGIKRYDDLVKYVKYKISRRGTTGQIHVEHQIMKDSSML